MVLVEKWSFFQHFVLGNGSQENVLNDILERKNAFLDYKNKKFKKSISWHFSKGVNPCLLAENGHFSMFYFLGNIGYENVFYDILERKDRFLGYNSRSSKNWKIDISPKELTHGFGRKMVIFLTFFFRQCRPGKCLLRYYELTHNLGPKMAIFPTFNFYKI